METELIFCPFFLQCSIIEDNAIKLLKPLLLDEVSAAV